MVLGTIFLEESVAEPGGEWTQRKGAVTAENSNGPRSFLCMVDLPLMSSRKKHSAGVARYGTTSASASSASSGNSLNLLSLSSSFVKESNNTTHNEGWCEGY